jgi:hypothetical protein
MKHSSHNEINKTQHPEPTSITNANISFPHSGNKKSGYLANVKETTLAGKLKSIFFGKKTLDQYLILIVPTIETYTKKYFDTLKKTFRKIMSGDMKTAMATQSIKTQLGQSISPTAKWIKTQFDKSVSETERSFRGYYIENRSYDPETEKNGNNRENGGLFVCSACSMYLGLKYLKEKSEGKMPPPKKKEEFMLPIFQMKQITRHQTCLNQSNWPVGPGDHCIPSCPCSVMPFGIFNQDIPQPDTEEPRNFKIKKAKHLITCTFRKISFDMQFLDFRKFFSLKKEDIEYIDKEYTGFQISKNVTPCNQKIREEYKSYAKFYNQNIAVDEFSSSSPSFSFSKRSASSSSSSSFPSSSSSSSNNIQKNGIYFCPASCGKSFDTFDKWMNHIGINPHEFQKDNLGSNNINFNNPTEQIEKSFAGLGIRLELPCITEMVKSQNNKSSLSQEMNEDEEIYIWKNSVNNLLKNINKLIYYRYTILFRVSIIRHMNNFLIDLEEEQKNKDRAPDLIFSASDVNEITNFICEWFNTYCYDLNIFKLIPNEKNVHRNLYNQDKLNEAKEYAKTTTQEKEQEEKEEEFEEEDSYDEIYSDEE